jgi:pimeloyl-ACP methyl ester carboxylesterase
MDGHQIERAHLLGFSDGGNIALIFALRYPDRVDKLVLNGANIFPEGLEDDILKEIQSEYEKLSSPSSDEQIRQRELLSLMVNEPHISPLELGKISAPSLVIAGTKDMIKAEHTRLIAESLPNSQLAFISGGHFIAASNPKKFNQTVFDFLMN